MSILLSLMIATSAATAAAVPTTAGPSGTADPLDTMKCVRETVTGSVAATRKVCHTLREWQMIRDSAQQEARRIVQPGWPSDGQR